MLDTIILLTTCIVNLGLGLVVLVRNPKLVTSVSFFLISVWVSVWAVANYYAGYHGVALWINEVANRIAFFAAFLAIAFGLRFVVNFLPGVYLGFGRKLDKFLAVSGIITALLSLTVWVAGDVMMKDGELHFTIGPLLPVYIVLIGVFMVLIIRTLLKVMTMSKGRIKQQAIFILVGFGVPPLLALFTNAIIPSITSSWHTAALGPTFTILLVGTIGYSMIKHRLFDIRLAVARSLAYVLSILTIAALYALSVLGIAYALFDISISLDKQAFLVLFSIVTALFFQPLLRFFNRISNSLFYRDAYEPQDVLDKLSTVLVGTVDIVEIEKQATEILNSTIKPSSIRFILSDSADKQNLTLFKQLVEKKLSLIIVDELPKNHFNGLVEKLQKEDIGIAIKLHTSHGDLGFMLLGYRRSGAPYSSADLKVLSVVADELALGVQNALRFKEIEQFNKTLKYRIDDATRQLRRTNEKLRQLDQTKDDFISMASHQLRTPLTSVKGYVSMVLEGDTGPITPLQRKLLNQSFVSAQRMVYLISDLLNVSRLRTGKFLIEPVPSNLAKVVQDEVEQLRETASGRNLSLTYEQPANFPTLMLDETKMRQVIMNFMDNAIYYTPSGGEIHIKLEERPLTVEFTVTDNGIGVPRHEQHHLFSKFYRAHNAKRARPDGTGLGLFMAKKVIVAQGGAIIFKSKEKVGSTFGFTFAKDPLLLASHKPAELSEPAAAAAKKT